MAEEKRLAQRINKRFVLRVAIFGEEPLRWSHVTIRNLSSSGALFTYDKPVKLGVLLNFVIDFPDRVVQCMGRVKRLVALTQEGMRDIGASFEGLKQVDREYIDAIIQKNASA